MQRRLGRWVALGAAIAMLGGGLACKKDGGGTPGGTAGAPTSPATPTGPAPIAGFAPSQSVLLGVPALETLPRDTLFVIVAESLEGLSGRLGRAELVAAMKVPYDEAAAELTREIGIDLFDPKSYVELGVDVAKPFGFAWLGLEDESVAYFLPLADAAKLLAALDAGRIKGAFTKETVGDATLVHQAVESDLCLVLRGKTLLVVVTGGGDATALGVARRLAAVAPADSLAKDAGLLAAVGALGFGKDAAGWLNVAGLLALAEKHAAAPTGSPSKSLEAELARLEADKADPNVIADMKASLASERSWEEQRRRELTAELAVVRDLLGTSAGLAFGAEVGARGVNVKATLSVGGGRLTKLLRTTKGGALLAKALGERPAFALGGALDPTIALEHLRTLGGADFDEGLTALREELSVDVAKDVLPLLTGEVEFALTGGQPPAPRAPDEFTQSLGLTFLVGVTDAAKAGALVDRVLGLPMVAPIAKKDAATGAYELAIPAWKPVVVAMAGTTLVITTDKGLLARVTSGADGGGFAATGHPVLAELAARPGGAAFGALDVGLSTMWLVLSGGMPERERALPPDPAPDVPLSDGYKAKTAEFEKLQADLKAAEAADEAFEDELGKALVRLLGFWAGRLELTADGVVLLGGHYVGAESLPVFAAEVGALFAKGYAQEEASRKRWALQEKLYPLEAEIARLRELDIQQYRASHAAPDAPPPPAPPPPPVP